MTRDIATGFDSDTEAPFIEVQSLSKVFGDDPSLALAPEYLDKSKEQLLSELGCVLALKDVNFQVRKGETFVIMGLSGSGKSTLVRCLIRLIEPTTGAIRIQGEDILQYDAAALAGFRRSKIAMVFQSYGLLPHRKVIDNVSWGLEVQGVNKASRYARTREVLRLVGLQDWEQAYPRELSGGMQQRVGLARALAVDPDILLMDEPFSGLDPLIRRNMQDELVRLQQDLHKTIIFITHDLSEALKIGDHIAIMRDGKIIQIGTPEDIVLRPEDSYVEEFTQDVKKETILCADSLMEKPSLTISSNQTPAGALAQMQSGDGCAAMVVDAQGRYLGLLTSQAARRAVGEGSNTAEQDLDPGLLSHIPEAVTADTSCEQLIPMVMHHDLPIPVIDGQGHLLGQVGRASVAAALTQSSSPTSPS